VPPRNWPPSCLAPANAFSLQVLITEFANSIDNPKAVLHLSEPSSATVISRLQDRQEAQLAADAAAAQHKLPPFWAQPSDVVSHSTYKPVAAGGAVVGSSSQKSEAVDRFLATLEQVQPAAPPSRALVATLKGLALLISWSQPQAPNAAPLTPVPGKYYELLDACSALDAQALGALSRADFERALLSSTLALQPHEVRRLAKQHPNASFSSSHIFLQVQGWMRMIKNENIDYDQVALRFASPVSPRPKCSITIAALKQKFSLLPAAAHSLDENGDGFLSEGEVAKVMTKAGIIMQLADIRCVSQSCRFMKAPPRHGDQGASGCG
jgi:hypothetical protein